MKITITVDGIERTYQGEYHELHSRDWNGITRDIIDDAQEIPEALRNNK